MEITLYQIDAFTGHVFGGNPAAVCPLEEWIDAGLMQKIAGENNLSETAFFVNMGNRYEIRWFTPAVEIDLAGHPTLAAAFVIFNYCNHSSDKISFSSKSGELTVTREGDLLKMNFPVLRTAEVAANETLIRALGLAPSELYLSRDYLAVYKSQKDILSIDPDFGLLRKLDCMAVIVTAPGDKVDFVSRCFAPSVGIDEDPVTGSAHSTLIPYWAQRLKKDTLHAYQLSKRGGELFCKNLGERVEIGGKAVPFMKGTILI
ncbi:MAG: PhzF family phenazine biosynthesis protein [Dehalococcoidia bacterium]|nr:PhzF family phenazine biosynthesis protein [Dehalococcoidia bacterium]